MIFILSSNTIVYETFEIAYVDQLRLKFYT